MKVGCLFLNIKFKDGDTEFQNYANDDFFTPNSINSFKKWHPDVDVHYVNDNNLDDYLLKLNIEEYYDHPGLMKIHIVKELMRIYSYDKMISMGIDTITCSRLDEFLDNNNDDLICTLGAPQQVFTDYYTTPFLTFTEGENIYHDIASINGDVICINKKQSADTLYDVSIKYWTNHAEQGGMNYCYINQKDLGIKVSIVDFPYYKSKVVYNLRSKGVIGGYCLVKGKVLNGRNGQIIDDVYPSLEFYVKENKLHTKDHKQIKVFHFAEGLGCRTEHDELSYDEQVNEMKTMWFNKETIEFFKNKCNCIF
jgi:hypothetical protein